MKQRTIVMILLFTLMVGVGLVIMLILNGERYRKMDQSVQETLVRIYATNTEIAAQTMTATHSVQPD